MSDLENDVEPGDGQAPASRREIGTVLTIAGVIAALFAGFVAFVVASFGAYQVPISLDPLHGIQGKITYLSAVPVSIVAVLLGTLCGAFAVLAATAGTRTVEHTERVPKTIWAIAPALTVLGALIGLGIALHGVSENPPRNAAVSAVENWAERRYEVDLTADQASEILDYVNSDDRADSVSVSRSEISVSTSKDGAVVLTDPGSGSELGR